ncbi:MAG: hypothetical protein H6551_03070 [Chitinophagales bacterium]|nr:hypothetical protein [Chitinophagales bacterium]
MQWLSFHIYFTGNRLILLGDYISPLITELKNKKLITRHFFIIYKEGGVHIRLRLKAHINHTHKITLLVQEKVSSFFSTYDLPQHPNISSNQNLNTIQSIPYEQEYERYGGQIGMKVSQKQFANSSDMVFKYIQQEAFETYVSLLNVAIKMNLTSAFVYSNGSIEKVILYFYHIYYGRIGVSNFPFIKFNERIELNYKEYYLQQKEIIAPFVHAIWNRLSKQQYIDDNLQYWFKAETSINKLLHTYYDSGKIDIPHIYDFDHMFYILQSYIHMNNNRLGISTVDEPLIAYLIMRSLQEFDSH